MVHLGHLHQLPTRIKQLPGESYRKAFTREHQSCSSTANHLVRSTRFHVTTLMSGSMTSYVGASTACLGHCTQRAKVHQEVERRGYEPPLRCSCVTDVARGVSRDASSIGASRLPHGGR